MKKSINNMNFKLPTYFKFYNYQWVLFVDNL